MPSAGDAGYTGGAAAAPAAPAVTVRFSVVSFAPQGNGLAVVGSCPELGGWQVGRALKMRCSLGEKRLQSEPDFHWVDVRLPADYVGATKKSAVEYKFIEYDLATGLGEGVKVRWEDFGADKPEKNRVLELDNEKAGEVVLLPVEKFAEGRAGESDHTGRFYFGVKERDEISVRRILGQIFLGSCPRQPSHIDDLKSLGITVVVNFQTEDDCKRNCVEGIGMDEDVLAVAKIYEAKGMEYIWLPTFDMSTEGRAQMLPHASHLFASLVRSGHVVYSHCNAGVGRSTAAVCGYLTFVLGLSERQMQHTIATARPVAYFDFEALKRARPHYKAIFGTSADDAAHDGKTRDEAISLLKAM